MININEHSLEDAAAARFSSAFMRPLYPSYCFSNLPQLVFSLFGLGPAKPPLDPRVVCGEDCAPENVVLFIIDGLGWQLLQNHLRQTHQPALKRLEAEARWSKLTSQFPSTTAGHISAMHSGLSVAESGVCEWFYYEPALQRVMAPLLYCYPGETRGSLLTAGIKPETVFPAGHFYPRLAQAGIAAHAFVLEEFLASPFNSWFCAGARVVPHKTLISGLALLADEVSRAEGRNYFYFYFGGVDETAHARGPSSKETAQAIETFFEALGTHFLPKMARARKNCLLLFTADHGGVHMDPAATFYLDRRAPEIIHLMRRDRDGNPIAPAGSPRDYLLYIEPDKVEEARRALEAHLRGRAEIYTTQELAAAGIFGPNPSERLFERIGNLIILPLPGESVFWAGEGGKFAHPFLGHHGGLTREEMELPLVVLPLQ